MERREILKSAGCVLFLPALESYGQNRTMPEDAEVKRLFCISMGYGFFTDALPNSNGAHTNLVIIWNRSRSIGTNSRCIPI